MSFLPLQSTATQTDELIFTTKMPRTKMINALQFVVKHVRTRALGVFN